MHLKVHACCGSADAAEVFSIFIDILSSMNSYIQDKNLMFIHGKNTVSMSTINWRVFILVVRFLKQDVLLLTFQQV